MKKSLRIACIQSNAGRDWEKNLQKIDQLIKRVLQAKPHLIALPETFLARTGSSHLSFLAQELSHRVLSGFCEKARASRTAFLLGSLIEPSSKKNLFYNTSYLISEKGTVTAKYRKIHLFDIALKKKLAVRESEHILSGNRVVTGKVWGVKCGLSVCYDLRFPELFRALTQAQSRVIFVPANFTETTGKAHWEILLRARAIENQVFVIAPAQVGRHPATGIKSFGTSLIIDPWGRVLARGSREKEEVCVAEINFQEQAMLRQEFPVLTHRRFKG